MNDFDEDLECPLCMEEIDITDKYFKPCPCGYQICRFCWNHIKEELNGLCPACRREYSYDLVEFTPVSPEEINRIKLNKKKRDKERKELDSAARRHLAAARVVQKNLIYILGLPSKFSDEEHLKSVDFFGHFGKVSRVLLSRKGHGHTPVISSLPLSGVYVFYTKKEDAIRAIEAVDGTVYDFNKVIRVTYGTTKYCSYFLKNQTCQNPSCNYLHEPAEEADTYAKEELSRQAIRDRNPKPAPFSALQSHYKKDEKEESALPATAGWAKISTTKGSLSSQPSISSLNKPGVADELENKIEETIDKKENLSPLSPKSNDDSHFTNSNSFSAPPPGLSVTLSTTSEEEKLLGSKALDFIGEPSVLMPSNIRLAPANSPLNLALAAAAQANSKKPANCRISLFEQGYTLFPVYNGTFDPFLADPFAAFISKLEDVEARSLYVKSDISESVQEKTRVLPTDYEARLAEGFGPFKIGTSETSQTQQQWQQQQQLQQQQMYESRQQAQIQQQQSLRMANYQSSMGNPSNSRQQQELYSMQQQAQLRYQQYNTVNNPQEEAIYHYQRESQLRDAQIREQQQQMLRERMLSNSMASKNEPSWNQASNFGMRSIDLRSFSESSRGPYGLDVFTPNGGIFKQPTSIHVEPPGLHPPNANGFPTSPFSTGASARQGEGARTRSSTRGELGDDESSTGFTRWDSINWDATADDVNGISKFPDAGANGFYSRPSSSSIDFYSVGGVEEGVGVDEGTGVEDGIGVVNDYLLSNILSNDEAGAKSAEYLGEIEQGASVNMNGSDSDHSNVQVPSSTSPSAVEASPNVSKSVKSVAPAISRKEKQRQKAREREQLRQMQRERDLEMLRQERERLAAEAKKLKEEKEAIEAARLAKIEEERIKAAELAEAERVRIEKEADAERVRLEKENALLAKKAALKAKKAKQKAKKNLSNGVENNSSSSSPSVSTTPLAIQSPKVENAKVNDTKNAKFVNCDSRSASVNSENLTENNSESPAEALDGMVKTMASILNASNPNKSSSKDQAIAERFVREQFTAFAKNMDMTPANLIHCFQQGILTNQDGFVAKMFPKFHTSESNILQPDEGLAKAMMTVAEGFLDYVDVGSSEFSNSSFSVNLGTNTNPVFFGPELPPNFKRVEEPKEQYQFHYMHQSRKYDSDEDEDYSDTEDNFEDVDGSEDEIFLDQGSKYITSLLQNVRYMISQGEKLLKSPLHCTPIAFKDSKVSALPGSKSSTDMVFYSVPDVLPPPPDGKTVVITINPNSNYTHPDKIGMLKRARTKLQEAGLEPVFRSVLFDENGEKRLDENMNVITTDKSVAVTSIKAALDDGIHVPRKSGVDARQAIHDAFKILLPHTSAIDPIKSYINGKQTVDMSFRKDEDIEELQAQNDQLEQRRKKLDKKLGDILEKNKAAEFAAKVSEKLAAENFESEETKALVEYMIQLALVSKKPRAQFAADLNEVLPGKSDFANWAFDYFQSHSESQQQNPLKRPNSEDSSRSFKANKIVWDLPEEPPKQHLSVQSRLSSKLEPPKLREEITRKPQLSDHLQPRTEASIVAPQVSACKFGASCTNPNCQYSHPSPAAISNAQPKPPSTLQIQCKYWPKCLNIKCVFLHPALPPPQPVDYSLPCKYDPFCKRPGCLFKHSGVDHNSYNKSVIFVDGKPVKSKENVHVSERTFAVDEAVEKIIVEANGSVTSATE